MPEFIIREAVPDDALHIITYLKQIAGEPENTIALSSAEEFTVNEEEERQFIEDHAATDNCILLVVESANGDIIGVANCTGGRRSATRHTVTLGISIHRDWRGRGIGRQVMQRLIDWARENSMIHRLELKVFAHNTRAIHLYESLGFLREVHLRETLWKYGQWRDSLEMALLFDKADS